MTVNGTLRCPDCASLQCDLSPPGVASIVGLGYLFQSFSHLDVKVDVPVDVGLRFWFDEDAFHWRPFRVAASFAELMVKRVFSDWMQHSFAHTDISPTALDERLPHHSPVF